MKRLVLPAIAAVLVFSLSACGRGQQSQPPANQPSGETPAPSSSSGGYDAATAETLFKNNCSSCHGQTLEGAVGPNLQHVGGKYTKEQILEILKNGKGSMPPGLVKGADADNVAAWLADKK